MSDRPTVSTVAGQKGDGVDLRTYLERIMDERDQRYENRFKAQETQRQSEMAGAKELTKAAFDSAKEAITKSEAAQSAYNARSNEFRQALDDQNRIQLPRVEADARFKALDDKIEELKKGTLRTVISASAIALSVITLLVMYFKK